MKLQVRFFILYLILFGSAVGFIFVLRSFDIQHSSDVYQKELTQHRTYYDRIVSVEGRSLDNLSKDYSYWDDMVSFVNKPDPSWGKENISPSLVQYGADMAFVYKADGSLAYKAFDEGVKPIEDLALPKIFFNTLKSNRLMHFYVPDANGVIEVRAATIHPSGDVDRTTEAKGYWLVGRYWDEPFRKNLGRLVQADLVLNSDTGNDFYGVIGDGTVSFDTKLKDWQEKPLAVVTATAEVPVITDLKTQYNRQIVLLVGYTSASIIIIVIYIWWLVLRPMKRINRSIKSQDPTELKEMALFDDTEFSNLAQTIQEFFAQKVKISEGEFKQKQLEELNKAKEEFLAVAAHELNGPVSNVKVFSEYLDSLLKQHADEPTINKQLVRIERQSKKIAMLINDLRLASKGEQKLAFQYSEFDFDEFLSEEVEEGRLGISQKITVEGATNKVIHSDPQRLSQVVSNLIRNAAKYSPETSEIFVRSKTDNNQVIVEFQDFGVGVSEDDQPHIFDRFYRAQSVVDSHPGLGLGLSVCKDIIMAMGGHIWVDSELGKGSRFYFAIPLTAVTTEPIISSKPAPPATT